MKTLAKITFPLCLILLIVGCENSPEAGNWDNPTITTPVMSPGFSDEARETGNGLFGNIESPTRIPSGGELTAAVQPSVPCADCATNPARVEAGASRSDPRYTYSLKNYPRPAHGCVSANEVSSREADRLLASQNLSVTNARGSAPVTDREKRAVAAGIKRVQELNGGPLRTGMGPSQGGGPYPFVFKDGNGSSQRANQINIGRNVSGRGHNHHGNSVAQHVHEWAHLIGNNGAYAAYRRAMGSSGYCMVSNYADNNANEQFAEVFTAFVTEPEILLNNSRTSAACRKAYEFFRDEFFDRGRNVENCIPHPLQ